MCKKNPCCQALHTITGICVISSKKNIDDEYELLALSFDRSTPRFTDNAKKQRIASQELTVCYGLQCPYIPNCIEQIEAYCSENGIKLNTVKIDSVGKAKSVPCVFNNWAVFYKGAFKTVHLLN